MRRRDGVIYGVVTSIEGGEEEETEATKTFFDTPFSFRYRLDEVRLIIHDAKSADPNSKDESWNGRFKAARPMTTYNAATPSPSYSNTLTPIKAPALRRRSRLRSLPRYTTPTDVQTFNFWSGFTR